jgi:3-phenylpropionate/trans-cinnamate dioxygenase ferredoxin reductase subunit
MIRRDYLVVGGGIGGASACEGIRKYDKRGSVTLVGAEPFPPYKRWIISKSFLREKESNLKKLQEFDERWFDAHKIEARFGTVVTQFNIERRLAVLANGESIEFTKACLAMGSRPERSVTRSHCAKWPTWKKRSWSSAVVCWHASRQQACA